MYLSHEEILGYHNDETTLLQAERNEMRDRRDVNRRRVKRDLKNNNKPTPLHFYSQGSYAMKTMIHHPEKHYDIDDGCYFDIEDLKGSQGAYMSALAARQMISDAVDDGSFNTPPEVHKNCVRIFYSAGYHVDIPVYRRVTTQNWKGEDEFHYELASSDWVRSDARDVTKWFDKENKVQSPDTKNGRQMRRIIRLIKKFSKSRSNWSKKIGSGFMITKLVTECYHADVGREDKAVYYTMKAIRDRLNYNLVVEHPVTPDSTLTSGYNDPKAKFLRDKLSKALKWLEVLFDDKCTEEEAMKAWDKVFKTTYFTDSIAEETETEKSAGNYAPAVVNSGILDNWKQEPQRPVEKKGGGRYA